jgi:hypothetical protein
LSLAAAREVVEKYRPEGQEEAPPSWRFPPAYYRAARMLYWLGGENVPEKIRTALEWSWRHADEAELPEAIEDWLRGRAVRAESRAAAPSGVALFRERGARIGLEEKDIAALFARSAAGGLAPIDHLYAAELLEKGGFFENARREYARAAGVQTYLPKTRETDAKETSAEERQRARLGLARMFAALNRWEEALFTLERAADGEAKRELASRVAEHRAPATLKHEAPWRRAVWTWVSPNPDWEWRTKALHAIAGGWLACSEWDATRLDEAGRTLWTWDPGRGSIRFLGSAKDRAGQDQLWFVHDASRERPRKGAPVAGIWMSALGARKAKRPFRIVRVGAASGEVQSEPLEEAQDAYVLPGGAVLVQVDQFFEVRYPLDPARAAKVLPDVSAYAWKLVAAEPDALFFQSAKRHVSAVGRETGRRLWRTKEEVKDEPAALAAAVANDTRFDLVANAAQLGSGRAGVGIGGVLACRDLQTGKLLWSYADPLFSVEAADARTWVRAAGPFEAGGRPVVCVVYPDHGVAAVGAEDGKPLWRANLYRSRLGTPRPPVLLGPVEYSAPMTGGKSAWWFALGEALLALDPATGRTLWSTLLAPRAARWTEHAQAVAAPRFFGPHLGLLDGHGRVRVLRLDARPAGVPAVGAETWTADELARNLETCPDLGVPARVVDLGLAAEPAWRERLRGWLFRWGDERQADLLVHATPFSTEEFERKILPICKAASHRADKLDGLFLLKAATEGAQAAAVQECIAQLLREHADKDVRPEQGQAAAAKLVDGDTGSPLVPPAPEDF